MSTCLAIFTCSSGSAALIRHWPFFSKQNADKIIVVTTDKPCDAPDMVDKISVGVDGYISGDRLPKRLVDTITELLKWDILILAEYDTLFFKPINLDKLDGVAAHLAGAYVSEYHFYHNPWVFRRDVAEKFVAEGNAVIGEGNCQDGRFECSPDVFFGLVCSRMNQHVQSDLWKEFSRNSMDREGDLQLARIAYRAGVDVIHGIKHQHELDFILS